MCKVFTDAKPLLWRYLNGPRLIEGIFQLLIRRDNLFLAIVREQNLLDRSVPGQILQSEIMPFSFTSLFCSGPEWGCGQEIYTLEIGNLCLLEITNKVVRWKLIVSFCHMFRLSLPSPFPIFSLHAAAAISCGYFIFISFIYGKHVCMWRPLMDHVFIMSYGHLFGSF